MLAMWFEIGRHALATRPRTALTVAVATFAALQFTMRGHEQLYRKSRQEAARTASFTRELADRERARGGRADVVGTLERGPWTIRVRPR